MIPQFKVFMSEDASARAMAVLHSGYIGQGPVVDEFEEALREKLGFKYGVTVNSGTSALLLALMLIGVKPGDEVISTPMTCVATNNVIRSFGADIVWADIDRLGNIDPNSVAEAVSDRTVAVVGVDWGGTPCDYAALRRAAGNIPIVIDAAHSFGALYMGEPIAASKYVDYMAFSFQAIKHLTTVDGGLLVVPEDQYELAKRLRWYGFDRTKGDRMRCLQDLNEIGLKLHMNDVNAAIGLGNLPYVDDIIAAHRENAAYYNDVFKGIHIYTPVPDDRMSSYWLYTIHVPQPSRFEYMMAQHGVSVSKVHNRNDIYSAYSQYYRPLPQLDKWFSTMVCIPVGWWLSKEDREKIAELTWNYMANIAYSSHEAAAAT